jgi:hypothetical protein
VLLLPEIAKNKQISGFTIQRVCIQVVDTKETYVRVSQLSFVNGETDIADCPETRRGYQVCQYYRGRNLGLRVTTPYDMKSAISGACGGWDGAGNCL